MKVSPSSFGTITLLALAGLLVGGCTPDMTITPRDINVVLDPGLKGKPVEINLYGANSSDLDAWREVCIDEYWKDGNSLRKDTADKAILSFESGSTDLTKTFSDKEPVWQEWKQRGGENLIVLAEIPGSTGSWKGDCKSDPRRVVIPLNRNRWDNVSTPIILRIHGGAITLETPFRPAER